MPDAGIPSGLLFLPAHAAKFTRPRWATGRGRGGGGKKIL